MYNVCKPLFTAIFALMATSLTLTSCSGGADNKGADARIALEKAQSAYNRGDAQECIALLDSIDSTFASESDVMKQSIKLRPKALMAITLKDIAIADSTVNTNRALLDSLKPLMIHIDVPGTEGYLMKRTVVDPDFMNKTGVSPRVSEIGEFYLVSSVNPAGGLQHWSLSAIAGNKMATTDTVPYDGTLNFRTNNSEVITFTPAGSEAIGALIAENPGAPVNILFNSQNGGSRNIALNAWQADGIATAYIYAKAVNDMRNAAINLERLNARKLTLQQQIDDDGTEKPHPIDADLPVE